MELIAQILSILGCAIMIFSFQFKNNRNLFIAQTVSAFTFFMSYMLLGAFCGALTNVVAVINSAVLFLGPKYRKKPILVAVCLGFVAVQVFLLLTFNGVWSARTIVETVFGFIVALAQVAVTIAMWKDDGRIIRNTRLFITSPAWLIYNIIVFSLGGIICEAFSMTSIIISFIRYGKDGFEK